MENKKEKKGKTLKIAKLKNTEKLQRDTLAKRERITEMTKRYMYMYIENVADRQMENERETQREMNGKTWQIIRERCILIGGN